MPRSRNKRSKASAQEYCSYLIEIESWEMPYSLSIGKIGRLNEGPLWEHASIKIIGNFIYPQKLVGKEVQAYIIGDRQYTQVLLNPNNFQDYEPLGIGSLTVWGENREYLGSLPLDVFSQIATLLDVGGYRYLDLHGHVLYRGKAKITSLRFEKTFDPDND